MTIEITTNTGKRYLNGIPNECPYCHKSITPNVLYGYNYNTSLEAVLVCPDGSCRHLFIGYYLIPVGSTVGQFLNRISQGTVVGRIFSTKVSEISPMFVSIYNQAYAAEQQNLLEICGVGYRKALEFLIKEYTIMMNPSDKENIEKKFLGKVIEDYVSDFRLKTVSKRAVWLGNDETHYVRKWDDKNLNDLKKLIDLTVHWIEMEALTSSFEFEMPE
jgi:hypothetical protein